MMKMNTSVKLGIVATSFCAVVIGVRGLAGRTDSIAMDLATPRRSVSPASPKDSSPAEVSTSSARIAFPADQTDPMPEGSATPAPEMATLEDLKPVLEQAFEESLYGAIEPNTFLDVALRLVELEVDSGLPDSHPTGAIRFPILGAPEGMEAELWVRHTNNPSFAPNVLALRVQVDPPRSPYIVEGAVRQAPEAHITLWTDRRGQLKHFGIMTNLYVDRQSRNLGIPIDEGEIPVGLQYTMNVEEPKTTECNMDGFKNGFPAELERPVYLGAEPAMEKLQLLNDGLLAMHGKLKD